MRRIFLSLLLALASSGAATAQTYRPFGSGRLYHYSEAMATGGVTKTFTFRVEQVSVVGGDSVFDFNETLYANGIPYMMTARPWNLFGGRMRWNAATGVATFETEQSGMPVAAAELRTRAMVGQSWAFAPGVQATLTARQAATVMGQPDTVQTIGLSDGQVIELSRRFGIVRGPNLDYYLQRSPLVPMARLDLRLSAIPELGLGTISQKWQAVYGYQIGDRFFTRWQNTAVNNTWGAFTASEGWTEQRVVARYVDADGSVHYDLLVTTRKTVTQNYGAGGPAPVTTTSFTASVPETVTLLVSRVGDLLSLAAEPGQQTVSGPAQVEAGQQHVDSLQGRLWTVVNYSSPYEEHYNKYAAGLGVVRSRKRVSMYRSFSRMVGYVKGSEVWGDTTSPRPLGVNREVVEVEATLAPNPSGLGQGPMLALWADRPQAAYLTLYDGLGRLVGQQAARLAGGEQRLPVDVAGLAPGLYRLRVVLEDGRQRVLPLVRE